MQAAAANHQQLTTLFPPAAADPVERRVSTVGRIHPHLEAKVVDPGTNRTLPRGQVRGTSQMAVLGLP